ncbi:methyltransferase family protein [Hespellia stercorisuis]|uniref:Protein-S-isoprenylcysteine O-methyltransferase Ste14 n=1 Tax=Hespellia stercorisuis DSM 15480 TaxID=1121950 RepID=A0A1M6L962_9FIRM|nr:isoprenylcysteine carboxylmethyltransferase family protein [Hespellia stercorisuis]SHJ67639.1 Protein-S-isoprenylcysteine O-methyltransferase Ste14 [Hespellia stercorisuis DSM 15480]
MRKKAMVYLVRVLLQKIIGFSLYLAGAGFVLTYAGSIYFISLFAGTMIISLLLLKANEETLAQRGKTATSSPLWDKVLLALFWLLNYFVVYWLAGASETEEHLGIVYWCGMVAIFFAAWISTKALLENTFLESTARIQRDRNQTVCKTGPYSIVRHPAYSGLILNCIGLCMIFPYVRVWICMAITALIIVVRTALEDKMLKQGLEGYLEYTSQTKYRLLPFVW